VNIFLSRPTWIPPEFESGISTFLTQLGNLGLVPRTLGVSDYPSKAPLDEVIDILADCKGAIILGVPQIEISGGSIKGNTITSSVSLGTEWNHLEAGLAYSAGIPVLIIHHHSVTRGIFDRGVLNAFLHGVDLSENNWSMQPSLNGAITKWKEKCSQGAPNFASHRKSTISVTPTDRSSSPIKDAGVDAQAAASTRNISAITFEDIAEAIGNMPPLQRETIANSYKGLKVEWKTYYNGGSRLGDGLIRVRFKPKMNAFGQSIICKVRDSEYPELGILREGAEVKVIGEIEEADRFDITLKNVRLSFK
jgi:hypothetical protein